jgi:predicted alpha/beta hydrolase family esterase
MSAESHHLPTATNRPNASGIPEGDVVSRWMAELEERIRRSPREAVLVAFLVGGLLQVFAVRSLLLNLVRLVLWMATPILFGFAAWRLYQTFEGSESLRQSSLSRHRTPEN